MSPGANKSTFLHSSWLHCENLLPHCKLTTNPLFHCKMAKLAMYENVLTKKKKALPLAEFASDPNFPTFPLKAYKCALQFIYKKNMYRVLNYNPLYTIILF